jgi:hypothetical protein
MAQLPHLAAPAGLTHTTPQPFYLANTAGMVSTQLPPPATPAGMGPTAAQHGGPDALSELLCSYLNYQSVVIERLGQGFKKEQELQNLVSMMLSWSSLLVRRRNQNNDNLCVVPVIKALNLKLCMTLCTLSCVWFCLGMLEPRAFNNNYNTNNDYADEFNGVAAKFPKTQNV